MLAHFRDHARFTHEDLTRLSRGLYLRVEDREIVLDTLERLGLLGTRASRKGMTLRKDLYKALVL